jgi:hypothetical protein
MGRKCKLKEAALAFSIALSLAQQITQASAFSTEPVAPPSANLYQNPAAQLGQSAVPQVDVNDPLALKQTEGTDVKIPGLGTLGTIPKVDFGLDLLYGPKTGAADTMQLEQRMPESDMQKSDMQIKGTFTHKF